MSKFKKTLSSLDSISDLLTQNGEPAIELEDSNDWEYVKQHKDCADDLVSRLDELSASVEKFVKTAKITDDDLKLYGEAMVEKVLAMEKRYTELKDSAVSARAHWEGAFAPLATARAEAERTKAAEARHATEEVRAREKAREEAEAKRRARAVDKIEAREAAARAEREQKEAEERAEYERERAEREEEEAAERKRMDEAEFMGIDDALEILESSCSEREYAVGVKALSDLAENIATEPSDPKFRRIKKQNEAVQADLTRHIGGMECLVAMGFRLKDNSDTDEEPIFELKEPSLADIDEWTDWYDAIKEVSSYLQEVAESTKHLRRR
eukprot:601940_1